ncbi:hypothetical protein UFOVP33_71 [uncultured Caudovirales phage]|uniref:Uncharacterized protein n=1 Tax=uncultured Caudovirales phage TaxID=2100421 RepID=A0A6J5KKU4_9CAUD|nr:hypothetical protein UFOVP33_71 [uncultured Caudovirales phage]
MANIKYSDLIDDVLPSLGADPSDPVTEYAIKRACIEFCNLSWVWKHLPDPINVKGGQAYYDLESPADTDISAVMDAAHNTVPLNSKSVAWLDAQLPGWRTSRAVPKYYTQLDTEQLILAAVPDSDIKGGLTLTLALQPAQSATGLPKWIFNQYLYTLADGAIARLMLMPNKPWTDLQNGSDRRAKFDAGIANARASANAALGRAAQRSEAAH